MRLVCPNCEAKYEVPEDAIPETGRDVQCANCGHAWFQMRPRAAGTETVAAPPAPVAEPVAVAAVQEIPAVVEPPPEPEPDEGVIAEASPDEAIVEAVPETAPDLDAVEDSVAAGVEAAPDGERETAVAEIAPVVEADASEPMADDPVVDAPAVDEEIAEVTAVEGADAAVAEGVDVAGAEASAAAAMAAPAAYAVDESVLAILREEAEREARARRAEGARPLETQADLGIDTAIPVAKVVETAPAPTPVETEADDKLANRRTRLPDVEEINSTLRPTEAADDIAAPGDARVPAEGRSSFRSGFLMVLTVAILGSALYGSADALAQAVPALEGPLKAYVGFVDSLRLQLDGLMQSATVAINGD